MRISKNTFLQYVCIYICIQFLNGRLAIALGSNVFYGGCLIFSLFLIFIHYGWIKEDSMFFLMLSSILILGVLTVIITGGSLSIATLLSLISRFTFVYVTIKLNEKQFVERFLHVAFVLAVTSLIIFSFVQIIGHETARNIMSRLYEIKNTLAWMPSSYGLFFICYNFRDASRNSYMFGEPGLYQMLMILAIYFTFYKTGDWNEKKKRIYLIVYMVTIVTIQSTTGFFSLIVFLMIQSQLLSQIHHLNSSLY